MIARVKPLLPPEEGDPRCWPITVADPSYEPPEPVEGEEAPPAPRVAWPGAYGEAPSLPVGWRLHRLRTELRNAPKHTTSLPYYAAALGICWRGLGAQFAARPPAGPSGRWAEDDLVGYGWRVVEELHAVGVPTHEIIDAGGDTLRECISRIVVASEGEVAGRVDFTGPPKAGSSGPSPRPG